ncbi:hypothetical protein SAMN05880574_10526 [Chryseobacterium sp. RU37D]|uniref:hypothetical protein n=1 Tax=Chryseobacterium sp. RU37D TaxID=1907397 RepID=UPI00095690CA|nr:hypothetical protein [Chryseobacterium sp. RU37D]SIQ07325.1 hypothetical protein SAMN05880574_10526 [Chryseobacterium sp. RU37D]
MLNIPEGSEVNLWFEDDLFCKVNMWFCLSILPENKNLTIYRILPKADEKDHWKGFSASTNSNLEKSFSSKILFDKNDIDLGIDLWKAYQENNKELLSKLSENQSICFPFLKDVIHAYLTINPENFIKNLIENGTTDFNEIFEKFRDELGILGFGDLQVKVIYDKISAVK